MAKTILITGATDGIGLEAAKLLASDGHTVLLHGRSRTKLEAAQSAVGGNSDVYQADLSQFSEVATLVETLLREQDHLDVLINNAGVLKAAQTMTAEGLDIRLMVNTVAPFILTRGLLPLMSGQGRIINLSSAAQAPVDIPALRRSPALPDMEAYAQSKLAITMWSRAMAEDLPQGPSVLAVNPGSLLASKMVKEGFGIAGNDLRIGADILRRAAVGSDFADVSGQYYDNDAGAFGQPHSDALDTAKVAAVVAALDGIRAEFMPAG